MPPTLLFGGKKGQEIDAAEAVFRINYAPTKGFERDVGSNTHFDVVNLQHTKPFVQGGGCTSCVYKLQFTHRVA